MTTPYYEDDSVTLWHGDSLEVLRELPDASVDCCVTSPPYFGLRDYGEEGQYGLEASPAEYVETMRALFAEVRRVLADDGTLWLNLGDSYVSSGAIGRNDAGRNFTGGGGNRLGSGNPGTSAITSTLTVPPALRVWAIVDAILNDTDQSAACYMLVTSLDQTDTAPSATAYTVGGGNTPNALVANASRIRVRTNTSGQVRYRLSFSDASITARLQTVGFVDRRGKL